MKKRVPICTPCKNYHPIHKDGFEYLDCMLFYKKRDNGKRKSNTDNNGWNYFISDKIYSNQIF